MPERYVCDVLREMRECVKTLNFSYLTSLIEETQTLVNRMEAAIEGNREMGYNYDRVQQYKQEKRKLKKEIEELKLKREELDEET